MQKRKVQLFVTCLVDQFFPEVAEATCEILHRLGVEVKTPLNQTCCGQPAFNDGLFSDARKVARQFLKAFKEEIPIVAPSGSCVHMVRHQYPVLFKGEPEEELALSVSRRTFELTEFIVNVLGVDDLNSFYPHKVTYHASCHMTKGLRIVDPPLRLLKKVKGLEFLPMKNADWCCGFGGVFAVKYPELSVAILEDKVRWISESGAQVVTSCDVSCLMHIEGYLRRNKIPVRAEHIALILRGEKS